METDEERAGSLEQNPGSILHFVHLVFTSREKIPFDIRHSCVKTEDGWFVQQLNRCFYSAYYVTVSGLGSGGGAGSCGR